VERERDVQDRAGGHASALVRVDARWDAARTERALAELHRRRRARTRTAVVSGGVLLALACVLAAWVGRGSPAGAPSAVAAEQPATEQPATEQRAAAQGEEAERVVRLADGSRVVPEASARVVVERVTDALIEVEVSEGAVSFDVVPGLPRRFEVRAGEVTVRVLGTSFRVEHRDAGRVNVSVTRGHVEVLWATDRADLLAGQEGTFPRDEEGGGALSAEGPAPETGAVAVLAEPRGARSRQLPATGPAGPTQTEPPEGRAGWRELAHASRYQDAFHALEEHAPGAETVRDAAEDLLLAADVARLSGHPAAAIPWLEAVERDHASDPRAVLASFTRGRILTELGRPAEGARALERVLEREPNGSLAEDALARAALAHSAAGDDARAAELADRYLGAFPAGRWSVRVRALRTGRDAER